MCHVLATNMLTGTLEAQINASHKKLDNFQQECFLNNKIITIINIIVITILLFLALRVAGWFSTILKKPTVIGKKLRHLSRNFVLIKNRVDVILCNPVRARKVIGREYNCYNSEAWNARCIVSHSYSAIRKASGALRSENSTGSLRMPEDSDGAPPKKTRKSSYAQIQKRLQNLCSQ